MPTLILEVHDNATATRNATRDQDAALTGGDYRLCLEE